MEAGETVTIHTHASFCKVLFDKGANCNRDCPFKVAFGEGQSLWPHNCTGSTPISGVIGVGVKSNGKHPAGKESLPLRQRERARGDTFMSKNKEKWKKGEQYEGEIAENP